MNLPNKLTLIRLMLVLPFVILVGLILSYNDQVISFYNFNVKTSLFLTCGIIFALGMITDWLDGYWARKHNQITTFGKLFDPIADKFMTSTAFIALAILGCVPFFIPIIFILRDILVDGSRNLAAKNNYEVQANVWGKLKTVLQTVSLLVLFFVLPWFMDDSLTLFNSGSINWKLWLFNIPTLLALICALASGFIYIWKIRPLINWK